MRSYQGIRQPVETWFFNVDRTPPRAAAWRLCLASVPFILLTTAALAQPAMHRADPTAALPTPVPVSPQSGGGNTSDGGAPPTAAHPPGEIDMTHVLVDDNGKPVIDLLMRDQGDPDCKLCGSLTLGAAIAHALTWTSEEDKNLTWEQRFARGFLAKKIRNDPKAKLSAGEVSVIERLLSRLYGAQILEQAISILDPGLQPPTIK